MEKSFVDNIIAYESGELDEDQTIKLFQCRTAQTLINAGLCTIEGG